MSPRVKTNARRRDDPTPLPSITMNPRLSLARILGQDGPQISAAMQAGLSFLGRHDARNLLPKLGRTVREIPAFPAISKSALQDSYGGSQKGPSDDFLVGRGLFYVNERRRLFLDCTSGHYQMAWGYNHPDLCAAIDAASREGVIWDNHSNIPQSPLKRLAHRLVKLGNAPGERDPLDTVLLGVCTGSVACAAALKIQLKVFERERGKDAVPVIIALNGNYHGTDMVPQFMRGMWPGMARPFDVVMIEPNAFGQLEAAFLDHGSRVAGLWAEPIMMNREAIALEPEYLRLAQDCCRRTGALMCIDEIQTGFWQPEIFEYRRLGLQPDLVILGKGMTAGYHPLSGVLLRQRHDLLQQYDAISTNGSASMPAFVALCSLELIQQQAARIRTVGRRIHDGFDALAAEFPASLLCAQGRGHLTGLKFRQVRDAKRFHRKLLQAGLWTRVHAYHEGHSTILTKLGLLADDVIVDFVLESFRTLVKHGGHRTRQLH
jgi:acetylornithine/N-succinyldiaminopimelate aminotransferase